MEDHNDDRLMEFLSKSGLTNIKWLKCFKDQNITDFDQIQTLENKEEKYESLSLEATPVEATFLRKIFAIQIPTDSSAVGLGRELSEVGLDVSYWSDVFEKQLSISSHQKHCSMLERNHT